MSNDDKLDEINDHRKWLRHEILEARSALWDGKVGKAFKVIEEANDDFEQLDELLEEELDE